MGDSLQETYCDSVFSKIWRKTFVNHPKITGGVAKMVPKDLTYEKKNNKCENRSHSERQQRLDELGIYWSTTLRPVDKVSRG